MALSKIQSESINLADNYAFTGNVTGAVSGSLGKVLQVKQVVDTTTRSNGSSTTAFGDTGIDFRITPSATTSKILIVTSGSVTSSGGYYVGMTYNRTGTGSVVNIGHSVSESASFSGTLLWMQRDYNDTGATNGFCFSVLDEPQTTNECRYFLGWAVQTGGTAYLGRRAADTAVTCPTIIMAMEIAG
jgi:hypothetical protein